MFNIFDHENMLDYPTQLKFVEKLVEEYLVLRKGKSKKYKTFDNNNDISRESMLYEMYVYFDNCEDHELRQYFQDIYYRLLNEYL